MIYYSLQHVSCFICVPSLSLFVFMLFTMFHAQIYILRSTSLHAYVFRSSCFTFYAMFSYVLCLFLFQVDVRVTCSHVCMMLLAMPCLDLCVLCNFSMIYGQILVFTCLYAWIHVLPCLCAKFLHVYVYVSMPICLDLCFHMPICLDLRSLHALCYLPCACALHAMFVCLDLGYVCHVMCYCSPFVTLSFFLVFWPIGSDPIQTLWSLSLSIHLFPYQKAWIILICMSILACFYALYSSQPLLFQTLPHLTPLTGLWFCGYT